MNLKIKSSTGKNVKIFIKNYVFVWLPTESVLDFALWSGKNSPQWYWIDVLFEIEMWWVAVAGQQRWTHTTQYSPTYA